MTYKKRLFVNQKFIDLSNLLTALQTELNDLSNTVNS